MSDQYTPSTEEIRHRAVRSTTYPAFASPTLEVAFDRWLAAFKRDTEIALLERLIRDLDDSNAFMPGIRLALSRQAKELRSNHE